jgi:hypothetical protein
MSITQVQIPSTGQIVFTDTALGTVDAVKNSACKVFSIAADNSANSGAVTYLHLYNQAGGNITLGTTPSDSIIMVPAGAILELSFFTGNAPGVTYSTALSIAATTTSGGLTPPSSPTIVSVVYQ